MREPTFDEFQGMEARKRRNQEKAGTGRESYAEETKPAKAYSVRDAVGNFVERFEIQLLVILLIGLDVITVTFQMFMESGVIDVDTPVMTNVAQLLQSFTGFTVFFFLMEIGLVFFAFGSRCFTHVGYMLDLAIVAFGLYWELNMDSKVIRLFGVLRVWRIMRLMNSMLAESELKHAATQKRLREHEQTIEQITANKERVEESLRREKQARQRVEAVMKGYKDENEVLQEALQLAAETTAEKQLLEELSEIDTSDDEDGGGEDMDDLGEKFLEAFTGGSKKSKFVVSKDGSYSAS